MKKFIFKDIKSAYCIISFVLFLLIYLITFIFLFSLTWEKDENIPASLCREFEPVIIIDPGHGGADGGAVSENGVLEKDINLEIAKYIHEYFKLSDFECILTRDSDVMLEPKNKASSYKKRNDLIARVDKVSDYPNPIFVSIHQNYFPSSKYKGLQVFYSPHSEKSGLIAEFIKDNNKLLEPENLRETKCAGSEIYVLDMLKTPAVLVECGFLSNAEDTEKLSNPKYQKKIAFMIFISLIEFLSKGQNYKL